MKPGYALMEAARAQAEGEVAVHKANILVYQTMPAGIGEHSDITEAVIAELDKLAAADDRLEMINKYFPETLSFCHTCHRDECDGRIIIYGTDDKTGTSAGDKCS